MRLCLLTVHAHPDDEASKGAGNDRGYHADGVHTVLVTCTGGEEGDILNPAMDPPEVQADIAAVRRRSSTTPRRSSATTSVVLLGYRDRACPTRRRTPTRAASPGRRSTRRSAGSSPRSAGCAPQVLVTYPRRSARYRHPDHLRVHEISVAAFDAAGDPAPTRCRCGLPAPEALLHGLVERADRRPA